MQSAAIDMEVIFSANPGLRVQDQPFGYFLFVLKKSGLYETYLVLKVLYYY